MLDKQQHTNEPERARSAFFCLDSSCPRDEWVRIGMAAKSAGLTFDDFHEWSKSSDKYKNRQDCLSTWKSFNADGGVTSSTLFDLAFKSGWQDSGGGVSQKSATLPHAVSIKKPSPQCFANMGNLHTGATITPIHHPQTGIT